ncbi:hypothetical protein HanRHA438_Chr07g0289701 [Helianthus annuus]|nr:hypothetical protein HanRHA438_Chr07g0289701 [Helianthus annuus]
MKGSVTKQCLQICFANSLKLSCVCVFALCVLSCVLLLMTVYLYTQTQRNRTWRNTFEETLFEETLFEETLFDETLVSSTTCFINVGLGPKGCFAKHDEAHTCFFFASAQGTICSQSLKSWPTCNLDVHGEGMPCHSQVSLRESCPQICINREHAAHCRELPGFKYRHDLVRGVLFDIFRCAGISAKKEAPVNFLIDPLEGRSTL